MGKVSTVEIVSAARDLFREKGFAGASMQDLADRVGIRKASLYSRFPDKESLIGKVLALTLDELLPPGDEAAGEWLSAYVSALGRIAGHLRRSGRCVALHLAYGVHGEDGDAHHQIRGFFTGCHTRIAEILRHGLPADLAKELATDTLLRIEGATIWLIVERDSAPLDRAVLALQERAEAMAIEPPPEVRKLLDSLTGDWRRASSTEKALAARLVDAEERVLFVEQALRGQVEAEACFL